MSGMERLLKGVFNSMSTEAQEDGSQVIILRKDGSPTYHRLHVKNLYQPDQEILEDVELPVGK